MEHSVKNYSDLVNSIVRPPREVYTMDDLGPKEFLIKDRKYKRSDVGLVNPQGRMIVCSHFEPDDEERVNKVLPWVIFCHGNCGSRINALPLVVSLLPHNITVFALDFAGSGRSEGEYVSLGWYEKGDLQVAIEYLRSQDTVSTIGLWGQSMGAVTCLIYAAQDPTIAGLVVDSPFSNLKTLCEELWKKHSNVPMFIGKIVIRFLRRSIKKKANFDIFKLDIVKFAKQWYSPWKFFYPESDDFVDPSHSQKLYKAYSGDKSITGFEGDHNSQRPQFFYDSGAIFFHNVLMCDAIMKVQGKSNVHNLKLDEEWLEKLPEFENTKFRQLDDVLKERDESGVYRLDEEIQYLMNRNRADEAQYEYRNEVDKDMKKAIQRSMTTVTEEQERDQAVIDFFNKIGRFKDLPEHIIDIYCSDSNFKTDKLNKRPEIEREKYEELVDKAIDDYLIGNISAEEIQSIRAMLFLDSSDPETEADSCFSSR